MYKLPVGGYKWMKASDIAATDFSNVDISKDYGFIAEVDLEVIFCTKKHFFFIFFIFSILIIYTRHIQVSP